MKITRYFLMTVSLVSAIGLIMAAKHAGGKTYNFDPGEVVAFLVLGTLVGVNFLYLLQNPPVQDRPSNWRPFRMIRLWLDAKEQELHKRAGH